MFELTKEEDKLVEKLSGMTELDAARIFVIEEGEKRRVDDIFEALKKLRRGCIVEVETMAGVTIIIDASMNISFCDHSLLSGTLCRTPCSRIL